MDNLLNVDNMEMVRTLGFLHDNIKPITHNRVQYIEDGSVYIVDLNDDVIIKEPKHKIAVIGTFVIRSTNDETLTNWMSTTKVKVFNLLSNKEIEVTISGMSDITAIGDQFISISEWSGRFGREEFSGGVLYNIRFEKVYKFATTRALKVTEDNVIRTVILQLWNTRWQTIVADKSSGLVDIYDSIDIDKSRGLSMVGKEWSKKDILSINYSTVGNVRYSLCIYGKIIDKLYQDIGIPQEFVNTNFLMVWDLTDKYRKKKEVCKGVIDITGRGLIPPVYDDVVYIGNNTFLLSFNNYVNVYNIYKGNLFTDVPKNNVWVHPILPFTVITKNDSCMAVNSAGEVFNILDIAKYYDCYASSEDENALKIDTGVKTVFVSRNLIPITNIHYMAKLNTMNWVKI